MYNPSLILLTLLVSRANGASGGSDLHNHPLIRRHICAENSTKRSCPFYNVDFPGMRDFTNAKKRSLIPQSAISLTFGVNSKSNTTIVLEDASYFRLNDRVFFLNATTNSAVNTTMKDFIYWIKVQEPEGRVAELRSQFQSVQSSFVKLNNASLPKIMGRSDFLSPNEWLRMLREYQEQIVRETQERVNAAQVPASASAASLPLRTGSPHTASPSLSRPTIQLIRGSFHGYFFMRIVNDIRQVSSSETAVPRLIMDTVIYFVLHSLLDPVLDFLHEIRVIDYSAAFILYHVLFAALTMWDLIVLGVNPLPQSYPSRRIEGLLNQMGIITPGQAFGHRENIEAVPADSIAESMAADNMETEDLPVSEVVHFPIISSQVPKTTLSK